MCSIFFYEKVKKVRRGEIIAVLDIDSERLATFDETDRRYLEQLVGMLNAACGN